MSEHSFIGYAYTVNSQVNPNNPKQEEWKNESYALTANDKTYASSYFTQTKKKKNKPYYLTAHNFKANIPSDACITRIRFTVRMRVSSSKNVSVLAPHGRFAIYGESYSAKLDNTPKGLADGWNDGVFWSYTNTSKLSTSWHDYHYTMNQANFDKGKFKISDVNKSLMGLDLIFQDAKWNHKKDATLEVQVAWVQVQIDYILPEYNITYNGEDVKIGKSSEMPQVVVGGEEFKVFLTFTNSNCGKGGNQLIDVQLPWGTELISASASDGTSYDLSENQWLVNADGVKTHTLELELISYKDGVSTLNIGNENVGYYPYYYRVDWNNTTGYSTINIKFDDDVHLRHKTCAYIGIEGYSASDDAISVTIDNDQEYLLNSISLDFSTDGVSLEDVTDNVATLEVPEDEDYSATLKVCFYPLTLGANVLSVNTSDAQHQTTYQDYNVLDAYDYHIDLTHTDNILKNHRVPSSIETDALMLSMGVKDMDSVMIQSECNIKMHLWDGLDYIGCVPLEHLHFDPKSTYKDTLIDTHYKNKRYMGKKLATDETITLNVRLHPRDVVTIQGLIEMDKPVPINANHKCFEGDPLNHRGYVELYGIKTEKTNPNWYKCEIDVKYLTHNLNTRFKIDRGNKVGDYPFDDLLVEAYPSGSSLGDDKTFLVDTDGLWYYNDDEEVEDNKRNMLSIDEKQYFNIYSSEPVASTSYITFEWFNTCFSEDKENYVERIISLRDRKTGNSVFTYQYYDYIVKDDSILCNVKGYRDDSNIDIEQTIQLRKGVDILDDEEDVDEEYDEYYGSKLHFNLNGNNLEVIDEGFNGKEVSVNNIVLDEGEYIFDVYFKNHNNDSETGDVTVFADIVVQESLLKSQFDTLYQKMYISPFPVANKTLAYTREAEEGTIYYYLDDGGEFSYLIEPYYQYQNGCDLKTYDGISIFNLNYGYEIVYIQNGLVRLGFNRLNGQLYLGKYDLTSKSYITTHVFRLQKYDDINLKSISDDKIEIQASDSIFTIYRGHPFIYIKHDDEDILIESKFNRVWAEKVGGDGTLEIPSYWDLMNFDNLLPSSIGGINTLNTHDATVSEVTFSDRNTSTLEWETVPTENIEVDTDLFFELDGSTANITDEIDIETDVYDGYYGQYTISTECDEIPSKIYVDANRNYLQTGESTNISAKVLDSCNNFVANQLIYFYEVYTPVLDFKAKPSIIQSSESATLELKTTIKDEDGNRVPLANQTINYYIWNDKLFYVGGTDSDTDTDSFIVASSLSESVGATGTTVTNSATSSRVYSTNVYGTTTSGYDYINNSVTEFDVVDVSKVVWIELSDGVEYYTSSLETGHYRVEYFDNVVKLFKDGVQVGDDVELNITGLYAIRFRLGNTASITYKNFKIGGY